MTARAGFIVLALTALPAAAGSGGVLLESGETLLAPGTSVSLSARFERASRAYHDLRPVVDPEDRVREEWDTVLGASYGFLPTLTAGLTIPWVWKSESRDGVRGRVTDRADGPGDAAVFGKYRFFIDTGKNSEVTASVLAGLQLPTGRTDVRDHGARLAPGLQPGSGSWDPFAGVAATGKTDQWEVGLSAVYLYNTLGAQRFKHGDVFEFSIQVTWHPWMTKDPGPDLAFSLGTLVEHSFPSRDHGRGVRDSGGDLMYRTFGVAFTPRAGFQVSAGFQFPTFHYLRGIQPAPAFRANLAVSIRF